MRKKKTNSEFFSTTKETIFCIKKSNQNSRDLSMENGGTIFFDAGKNKLLEGAKGLLLLLK